MNRLQLLTAASLLAVGCERESTTAARTQPQPSAEQAHVEQTARPTVADRVAETGAVAELEATRVAEESKAAAKAVSEKAQGVGHAVAEQARRTPPGGPSAVQVPGTLDTYVTPADRQLIDGLRKAISADAALSAAAPGVQMAAANGKVTLMGRVASSDLRAAFLARATSQAGTGNVVDELEVVPGGR